MMGKQPKIALVCISMNELGGKNNHLKNIYLSLSAHGFDMRLILCSGVEKEARAFFTTAGVPSEHLIFLPRWQKRLIIPFLFDLWQIFRREQFDIVHTFQIQSDVLASLPARAAKVPTLLSYYESKFVEDNISFIKQWIYYFANRFIKRWFQKTVVVSFGLKKEAQELHFRPEGTVEVVPLGIKMPVPSEKIKNNFLNLKKGSPVIGTIGRFSIEKGLLSFIRAIPLVLEAIPEASFVLVGKGPQETILRCLAEELKINHRIIFRPWTSDIFAQLNEFDIFVMPSHREGCPTALLEAMGMARPVVASAIPGISEIIEDGKDGKTFPKDDVAAFARAIIFLCQNPIEAIDMGVKAREKILTSFLMEKEMEHLKNIYLSISS